MNRVRTILWAAVSVALSMGCQPSTSTPAPPRGPRSITVEPLLSGYRLGLGAEAARSRGDTVIWTSTDPHVLVISTLADLDGQVAGLGDRAAILTQDGVLTPIGGQGTRTVTVTASTGDESITQTLPLAEISYGTQAGRKWLVTSETVDGVTSTEYDPVLAPDVGVTYTVTVNLPAEVVLDPTFSGATPYPGWNPELPVEVDASHTLPWVNAQHESVSPGTPSCFPEYTTLSGQLNTGYMTRSDHPGYLGFIAIGKWIYATQGLRIEAAQPNQTTLVMAKPDGAMMITLVAEEPSTKD